MTIGVMKNVLLSPNEEGFGFFCSCGLNEVDSRELKSQNTVYQMHYHTLELLDYSNI